MLTLKRRWRGSIYSLRGEGVHGTRPRCVARRQGARCLSLGPDVRAFPRRRMSGRWGRMSGLADDRGKGVPSFDEMVAIILEEVDFDDPTMNVRRHRALEITKPTSEG